MALAGSQIALVAVIAGWAFAFPVPPRGRTGGLSGTPRARAMLAAARSYLPADWRYPSLDMAVPRGYRPKVEPLLPVKVREQRFGYSCGAASLGILLTAYGMDLPDQRIEALVRTTKDGVEPWDLVNAARELGLRVGEKYHATAADILGELAEGHPVLIDFQASYTAKDDPKDDWGHYSVVVAADELDFLVADPSAVNPEHVRRIPQAELAAIWWDTNIKKPTRFDGWMMWLRPGRAAASASPKPPASPGASPPASPRR